MPLSKPLIQNYIVHSMDNGLHQGLLDWDPINPGTFFINMKRRNSSGWSIEYARHYIGWDQVNFESGIKDRKPDMNNTDYLTKSRHRFKAAFFKMVKDKQIIFRNDIKKEEVWICKFVTTVHNTSSPGFSQEDMSGCDEPTDDVITDTLGDQVVDAVFENSVNETETPRIQTGPANTELVFICKVLLNPEKVYDVYLDSNNIFWAFENEVYIVSNKIENIFEALVENNVLADAVSVDTCITSYQMTFIFEILLFAENGQRNLKVLRDSNKGHTWVLEGNLMTHVANLDVRLITDLTNGVNLADLAINSEE